MLQDDAQHCSPELETEDFTNPRYRQQDKILHSARGSMAADHDQEECLFRTTKRPSGIRRRSASDFRSRPISQYSPVSGRHDDMPTGAWRVARSRWYVPLLLFS